MTKNRNADESVSCDHCDGYIRAPREQDDDLTYVCDDCGCRWAKGMILIHKGQRCPVHGEAAQQTAIKRAARWLADDEET